MIKKIDLLLNNPLNILKLSIILVLLSSIRPLFFIGVWGDEAFSINLAGKSIGDIIAISIKDTSPPLHALMLHALVSSFGNAEFIVRSISLISCMGVLITTYYIAVQRKLFNKTISLSLLLVATSPTILYYATEVRNYALFTFFSTLAVYLGYGVLDSTWKRKVWFILTCLGVLYTNSLGIIVLVSVGCMIALETGFKTLWTKKITVLSLILPVIVAFLPWLFILQSQVNSVSKSFWLTFNPLTSTLGTLYNLIVGAGFEVTIASALLVGILIVFASFALVFGIISLRASKNVVLWYLPLLFGGAFLISFKTPVMYFRYVVYCLPVLMIILAAGFVEFSRIKPKIGLVPVAIFLVSAIGLYQGFTLQNPNLRANAKQSLSNMNSENSNYTIIHSNAGTFHNFAYYQPSNPGTVFDPNRSQPFFFGTAILSPDNYFNLSSKLVNDSVYAVYNTSKEANEKDDSISNFLRSKGYNRKNTYSTDSFHSVRWSR
jgi:hypothetical protein